MKSCYKCKHERICKFNEKFQELSNEALKQRCFNVDNSDNFDSWMNIFSAIGQTCNNFEYDDWASSIMIAEVDEYVNEFIESLKKSEEGLELNNITLTVMARKSIIDGYCDDKYDEMVEFLDSIGDKIKFKTKSQPEDFYESLCDLIKSRLGC